MTSVEQSGPSTSYENVSGEPQLCSYQVVQTLGEGAFGTVSLIVARSNPKCAIAMKKMDISDGDKEKKKLIEKEGGIQRYLSRVGHDNIVRLVGMENDANWYYIFLEYVDGGELFDQIEPDIGLPSDRAQFYFRQLINGLEYIHSCGIIHRDIKPENLLLTSKHVLKISDFGMATVFRFDGEDRPIKESCGTLPYAAPEVISCRKYRGEPVDIWSSGVVLIVMLTGEIPWERADNSSLMYKNWISSIKLDEKPWTKIDVRGISFLRTVVTNNVSKRATIKEIKNHPWYTHDYGSREYNGQPLKRQRFEEIENIPCTQIPSERNSDDDFEPKHKQARREVSSFSQPTRIDDMLLSQQIDMSQEKNLLQRLVCRMTRFCVKVGIKEAIQQVSLECKNSGYSVRQQSMFTLLVIFRDSSMMINAYEMIDNGTKIVMIDCRRSRGDGIQFKRMFINLRNRIHDLICTEGNNWLKNWGLCPSQDLKLVKGLPKSTEPNFIP